MVSYYYEIPEKNEGGKLVSSDVRGLYLLSADPVAR